MHDQEFMNMKFRVGEGNENISTKTVYILHEFKIYNGSWRATVLKPMEEHF